MKNYLLDTNSIIYAIKEGISLPSNNYSISIITEIELLSFSKLSVEDELVLKDLFLNFKIIELTNSIKDKTINIRKNHNIKLPDSIILASTLQEDATLVTSDIQLLKFNLINSLELKDLIKS